MRILNINQLLIWRFFQYQVQLTFTFRTLKNILLLLWLNYFSLKRKFRPFVTVVLVSFFPFMLLPLRYLYPVIMFSLFRVHTGGSHSPFPCILHCNLPVVWTGLTCTATLVPPHTYLAGTMLPVSPGRAGYSP